MLYYPDIHTTIDLDRQLVDIDGVRQEIRPKTFQLLKVLVEASGELVSKEQLLAAVWDDVVVDEQVVFQSVKELRKLFPGQTAIKTVPRKGYAWLPKAQLKTPVIESNAAKMPRFYRRLFVACGLIAVILVVALIEKKPAPVSGSVVVLPVQSDIPGSDHDWVRYGIMDQVISRLRSTASAGVLQTDYVLEVMARAGITDEDIAAGALTPVFDVSGAELILSMRLTGNPKDYQLVYTFYQRDGIQKGAVLHQSLQDAADEVAQLAGRRIDLEFSLSDKVFESSFANRLVAEAVEARSSGDKAAAKQLLEAAVVTSPNNVVAARLLVQTLVETGEPHSAVEKIAVPALQLATQRGAVVDQIRLGFWYALSNIQRGSPEEGFADFQRVKELATSINDWLYMAYIEEISGQADLGKRNFASAGAHYQQAMQYHRILHCPLGQSNTLMHMSRLAHAKGNQPLAVERAEQALDMIKARNLAYKLPVTLGWLEQISPDAQR